MSGKKKVFIIEKVPLGFTPEIKLPDFPPIPRLYLELLENKPKVKTHLRHLEWEPKESTNFPLISDVKSKAENDVQDELNQFIVPSASPYQPPPEPVQQKVIKEEYSVPKSEPVKSFSFVSSENKEDDIISASPTNSPRRQVKFFGISEEQNETNSESQSIISNEPDYFSSFKQEKIEQEPEPLSEIEKKMLEIENATTTQDKPLESTKPIPPVKQEPLIAPSLKQVFNSDLPLPSSADPLKVKDLSYNGTNKELEEKRDLLFKFKILKRKYKEANIPDFPEYTDLATIKREYDTIVRQLRLDSTVEDYKNFLTMAFFGLEFVIVNFMKWEEMRGFSADQMVKMNKYEAVLVELGEKHYNSPIMQVGPELKLIGIVLIQAITFAATKMLMKGMGGNIMSSLASSALGGATKPNPMPQSAPTMETKSKMKPPPININELLNKKNS
jgi:hypothetical protein